MLHRRVAAGPVKMNRIAGSRNSRPAFDDVCDAAEQASAPSSPARPPTVEVGKEDQSRARSKLGASSCFCADQRVEQAKPTDDQHVLPKRSGR